MKAETDRKNYKSVVGADGLHTNPKSAGKSAFLPLVLDRNVGMLVSRQYGVFHTVERLDLQVPDDLALVSFEDTPGICLSVPFTTAIRQPTATMVARAYEGLIKQSSEDNASGCFEVPFELIKRESTASNGQDR